MKFINRSSIHSDLNSAIIALYPSLTTTDTATSVTQELIDIAIDRFLSEYPENGSLVPELRGTLVFMLDSSISELYRRDSWWLEITCSPMSSIRISYAHEGPPQPKRKPTTERHLLNRMMRQAVLEENYELAAILRDRIGSLATLPLPHVDN